MPLSNMQKMKLRRWFWITVSWMLVALFHVLYDYLTLANYAAGLPVQFSLSTELLIKLPAALLAGLVAAWVLVFRWEKLFGTRSFVQAVLNAVALYFGSMLVLCTLGIWMMKGVGTDVGLFSGEAVLETINFLTGPEFVKLLLFWGGVFVLTIFVMMANDKYGPGQARALLLGKYFNPRKEQRIFMFLDIRSSTTIAEQLGEEKYFGFVSDFFRDITSPVLAARGEFYQYVGDEAVISWKMHRGLSNANCLRCFFAIQDHIASKANHYQQAYGVVPEFKAGVHAGPVTAGEIGVVKKDVVFSGDVLNTTARIQAECNKLGSDLLVSNELLNQIDRIDGLAVRSVGELELRGKSKPVAISAVSLA